MPAHYQTVIWFDACDDELPNAVVENATVTFPSLVDSGQHTVNAVLKPGEPRSAIWDHVSTDILTFLTSKDGNNRSIVSIWGYRGTAKTELCYGDDEELSSTSIIGSLISKLLDGGEEVKMAMFLHCDDIIIDLDSGKDECKIKDGIIEGGKYVPMADSPEHIMHCLRRRKKWLEKTDRLESMCSLIFVFYLDANILTVIEHADLVALPVPRATLTDAQVSALAERDKQNAIAMNLWHRAALANDLKELPRESKLARVMGPGIAGGIIGEGCAYLVVCAPSLPDRAYEALYLSQFCAGAFRQDLMSEREYKALLELAESAADAIKTASGPAAADAMAAEAEVKRLVDELARKKVELRERSKKASQKMDDLQKKLEKEKALIETQFKDKLTALGNRLSAEKDRIKNYAFNAPEQERREIESMIDELAEALKERKKDIAAQIEQVKNATKMHKAGIAEAGREAQRLKEEAEKAEIPIKELERVIRQKDVELNTSKVPCREKNMTEEEIQERLGLWEERDALDDLEAVVLREAEEIIAIEEAMEKGIGHPDEQKDANDVDGKGSDAPSETESEKAERLRLEEERKAEEERASLPEEWAYLRDTIRKDVFEKNLKRLMYSHVASGLYVYTINQKSFEFRKTLLWLSKKGFSLRFNYPRGDFAPGTEFPPVTENDRVKNDKVIKLKDLIAIHLGQHSPVFQYLINMIGMRNSVSRDVTPPFSEELTIDNMHRFYYASATIKYGEKSFLDIIFRSLPDFEAFITKCASLELSKSNNPTPIPIGWGRELYLEESKGSEQLRADDLSFCATEHIMPEKYLIARGLLEDERRLYVTALDIHIASKIDLFHSYRCLDFFFKQEWVQKLRRVYNRTIEEHLTKMKRTPTPDCPLWINKLNEIGNILAKPTFGDDEKPSDSDLETFDDIGQPAFDLLGEPSKPSNTESFDL